MTISAQVIDTIVEWIDDNLHQPLRIDDIGHTSGRYRRPADRCRADRGRPAAASFREYSAPGSPLCTVKTAVADAISNTRHGERYHQYAAVDAGFEGKPATPHPAQHQILNGAQR